MVPVPFWIWLGITTFLVLGFLFCLWFFFPPDKELEGGGTTAKPKDYLKCPYCGVLIEKREEEKPLICPVCKSYL